MQSLLLLLHHQHLCGGRLAGQGGHVRRHHHISLRLTGHHHLAGRHVVGGGLVHRWIHGLIRIHLHVWIVADQCGHCERPLLARPSHSEQHQHTADQTDSQDDRAHRYDHNKAEPGLCGFLLADLVHLHGELTKFQYLWLFCLEKSKKEIELVEQNWFLN